MERLIVPAPPPPKPKIFYLPQNYKDRRHVVAHYGEAKTGEISPSGTATQYEHWDGSIDATVRPQPVRMKLTHTDGAPPNTDLIHAVSELEEATRELALAKRVGNAEWIGYAKQRHVEAKRRVAECQ